MAAALRAGSTRPALVNGPVCLRRQCPGFDPRTRAQKSGPGTRARNTGAKAGEHGAGLWAGWAAVRCDGRHPPVALLRNAFAVRCRISRPVISETRHSAERSAMHTAMKVAAAATVLVLAPLVENR